MHNHEKKIAVINDFCGFGRCSLTVSLPIISALKVQCCPLPTSVFSNHTGFEQFYSADFTQHMKPYIEQWKALDLNFSGILTGYLGSPEQIAIVQDFLYHFKKKDTVVVMDPVMGDYGKLYPSYSPLLADKMKELVPYADILTPNLTEACFLTKTPYKTDLNEENLTEICKKIAQMGPKKVVISGLEQGKNLENFIFEDGNITVVTEHKVGPNRAGTGDVFSSILAADTVNGMSLEVSVRHASAFIAKVLRRALELNLPKTDGLCFEEFLTQL